MIAQTIACLAVLNILSLDETFHCVLDSLQNDEEAIYLRVPFRKWVEEENIPLY